MQGSLSDLDSQLSLLPLQHPIRARIIHDVAVFRFARYQTTPQKGDLDQVIVDYSEALLRGLHHPIRTITTFHKLICALHARFEGLGETDVLDNIVAYFRHLSGLPLEVADIDRIDVLNDLACALQGRFVLEGRMENVDNAILLRCHIVAISPPDTDVHHSVISDLANAIGSKFEQTGEIDHLIEAISHYRLVLGSCRPDHPARPFFLSNLATWLMRRSEGNGKLNDLDEAAALFRESFDTMVEKDSRRTWILIHLAGTSYSRYEQTGDLEDLEQATSRYREVLSLSPPRPRGQTPTLPQLCAGARDSFRRLGHLNCFDEAISLYRTSFRLQPPGHIHRYKSTSGLAKSMSWRFLRTHKMEHLREASELHQPGHPWARMILHALAWSLTLRFEKIGAEKDIVEAIKHYQSSFSLTPARHPEASTELSHCAIALFRLYELTADAKHLEESMAFSRPHA